MSLFSSLRGEFKLTNAKKYLQRQARQLAWEQNLHGIDHAQEIEDLKRAAYICWRLSWMA